MSETALQACRDYDHWASEVRRLSGEIGATECPREIPPADGDWSTWQQRQSCFTEAKEDRANWRQPGPTYEDPPMPPTLAQLTKIVADCPACSRLCSLIAERRHARQRFGVAKRRVRQVGRARNATPDSETNPAPSSGTGRGEDDGK